jgi:hypothetical protein
VIVTTAFLILTAACSTPPSSSHAPTSTHVAHPTPTSPASTTSETPTTLIPTTTSIPAVVSEVDSGPDLPYLAVYKESFSEPDGKIQSDLLEAGSFPSPIGLTWFFDVGASSAPDRYTTGTWGIPGRPDMCTRSPVAGDWKCDLYNGAPNGFEVIHLHDPQFGLPQALADVDAQPVAPAALPTVLVGVPRNWDLSCWRFGDGKVPVVTACVTRARVIAYFDATSSLLSFGGPETIYLLNLSTDVSASAFRPPAPVTGTTSAPAG